MSKKFIVFETSGFSATVDHIDTLLVRVDHHIPMSIRFDIDTLPPIDPSMGAEPIEITSGRKSLRTEGYITDWSISSFDEESGLACAQFSLVVADGLYVANSSIRRRLDALGDRRLSTASLDDLEEVLGTAEMWSSSAQLSYTSATGAVLALKMVITSKDDVGDIDILVSAAIGKCEWAQSLIELVHEEIRRRVLPKGHHDRP